MRRVDPSTGALIEAIRDYGSAAHGLGHALGVPAPEPPRFSWWESGTARAEREAAYRRHYDAWCHAREVQRAHVDEWADAIAVALRARDASDVERERAHRAEVARVTAAADALAIQLRESRGA